MFLSREKIVGLDGVAGTGKTTTLAVIREGAEAQGYKVEGFAPTSRAAQKLADAGMETSRCKSILRGDSSRTPGSAACMCSMNRRSRPPNRYTSL